MSPPESALTLALRKQRLQMQSDLLRVRLAGQLGGVAPVLGVVDQARAGVRWLKAHPLVPLAALLGLLLARPRRGMRLVRSGVLAWQLARRARRWAGAWWIARQGGPRPGD